MAIKNSDYWKSRFEQLENASHKSAVEVYNSVENQYIQAQKDIETKINSWYQRFANNNQITMVEAKKLLNTNELKELKWDINEYIKYGEKNAINDMWMKELENASAKYHISRLESLKIQTQQSMEVLFGNQLDYVDEMASNTYRNNYYHSCYELQKGFNIGWKIASIDENKLRNILNKPWAVDEKNFSERIWQNKTTMINELHNQLAIMCIQGKSPDDAIKYMAKKFNTSKAKAGNLIMTESCYFSSLASKDCFNNLDVEEFENVATLDSHTSAICQDMDGTVYKMEDYQPGLNAPPFHNYCRTVTIPHFENDYDEKSERAARDEKGNTYYVPDNLKYKDWYNKYVVDKNKLKNEVKSAKIKEEIPKDITGFYNYIKNIDNKEDFITYSSNEGGYITGQRLNSILEYDALPTKVSKEEFENLVSESELGKLYRGISGENSQECKSYIDNFINGQFYVGGQNGHIYGKGTYTGFGELGNKTANTYANESTFGEVFEMLLSKDAKTINYFDLHKEVSKEVDIFVKENFKKYDIDSYMKLITNLNKIQKEDEFITQYVLNFANDYGYYASIKGYDAIVADYELAKQKYVVILNRGKVIVSE